MATDNFHMKKKHLPTFTTPVPGVSGSAAPPALLGPHFTVGPTFFTFFFKISSFQYLLSSPKQYSQTLLTSQTPSLASFRCGGVPQK